VRLYQTYVTICDDIFAQLRLSKVAIGNNGNWTAYHWSACYRTILAFLRLPATTADI